MLPQGDLAGDDRGVGQAWARPVLCPSRPVPGALAGALVRIEHHLAHANHFRRYLDALINGAEFQSLLQPEDPRAG